VLVVVVMSPWPTIQVCHDGRSLMHVNVIIIHILLLLVIYTTVAPRVSVVSAATRLTIEAKQNSLKRQKTTERNRVYNKSKKSEIATRMKKVFTALEEFKASPPKSESDLEPVGALMREAYQVIDKAVVKGVLHRNTADRRKARLAKARQYVLVEAGLYTPSK
jgi:small subunit ribosomal protein S20